MLSAATLVCLLSAFVDQPAPLDEIAQKVAQMVVAEPNLETEIFHELFLKDVPPSRLKDLCRRIFLANGKVTGVSSLSRDTNLSGRFLFQFEKRSLMEVTLNINRSTNSLITGLLFHGSRPGIKSWDEFKSTLEKLPGQVSFCAMKFDKSAAWTDDGKTKPGTVLAELNSSNSLAIGSAFKLYILLTLIQQGAKWDQVIPLNPEYFSLPSGVMHKWPAESPVTLHTLALQMISISDNTATDHLLHYAGRDKVWECLVKYNREPQKSHPFLSTLEMFKLKSNEALLQKYLEGDFDQRMSLLNTEVSEMPRSNVAGNPEPVAVDTVEWFASAEDLCRLMAAIAAEQSEAAPNALKILSVNPGVGLSPQQFPYVGYKGGSEAGVINMTWLLRDSKGQHYAVAGTWNNTSAPVENERFAGLMTAAIYLLTRESPAAD